MLEFVGEGSEEGDTIIVIVIVVVMVNVSVASFEAAIDDLMFGNAEIRFKDYIITVAQVKNIPGGRGLGTLGGIAVSEPGVTPRLSTFILPLSAICTLTACNTPASSPVACHTGSPGCASD